MKIILLKNNEIVREKTHIGEYVRDEKADKGFGWYTITKTDAPKLNPWESMTKELVYIKTRDSVEYKYKTTSITLDEYKLKKYKQIKSEGSEYILSTYSLPQQTSALAGFYSDDENAAIISFTKKYFDVIRLAGDSITAAKSFEEVDEVYFKYTEMDDETMEVISTTFWGE